MAHELKLPVNADRGGVYKVLLPQIKSLIEDEHDLVANLANVSAALQQGLQVLWVGFYLRKNSELVLGPFQGPVACTRIALEPTPRGVCGAAASKKKAFIVPDVEKFPGHIACSSRSKSEIVVPLVIAGYTTLVLDIDSEALDDFSDVDEEALSLILSWIKERHYSL